MRRLLLCLIAPAAFAASLALPDWLAPYPGSSARSQTFAGLIESSYTVTAKPADIVAHYQKEFDTAQVRALISGDGQGIVMRGSAAECDLLIRIRQQASETSVSVSCSEKSSPAAQETYLPTPSAPRSLPPRSAPDREQALAQMRARREEHMANMKKFDQPVSSQPSVPAVLQWPSWLVHMPSADHGLQVVRSKYQSGLEHLTSTFKTSAPMTSIYNFYYNLLIANGYRVTTGHVSTGSTSNHVQQNAEGALEATLLPNGAGNGSLKIRIDFDRMFLNEPITVVLNVTVYPR